MTNDELIQKAQATKYQRAAAVKPSEKGEDFDPRPSSDCVAVLATRRSNLGQKQPVPALWVLSWLMQLMAESAFASNWLAVTPSVGSVLIWLAFNWSLTFTL